MQDVARGTCSVDECDSPRYCKGLCTRHYQRMRAHGDPLGGGRDRKPRLKWPDGLLRRMEPQSNGCIHFAGYVDPGDGYGRVWVEDHVELAHRAAYEHFVGPIPDGMVLDHECHNRDETCLGGSSCPHRRCVNHEHLAPKSIGENVSASPNTWGNRTHCVHGHEFTPENTAIRRGKRSCRTCERDRMRRVRAQR